MYSSYKQYFHILSTKCTCSPNNIPTSIKNDVICPLLALKGLLEKLLMPHRGVWWML